MISEDHLVMVLDDDRSILQSLKRLLTAHGLNIVLYSDATEFLKCKPPTVPACLILDNLLGEGMTGLQVYSELHERGWKIPTVFLTAHWNVQSVVEAMRAGADGFLTKPFDPEGLVVAVTQALQRARENFHGGALASEIRARAATLTDREKEVVCLVANGLLNKEIAHRLNLALVTVKVHRGRAMHKLGAGNAAELARIAAIAGLIC